MKYIGICLDCFSFSLFFLPPSHLFIFISVCTGALHYGNANSTWKANDYYPIGDIQTIECNEGYQYLWNGTKQNVTCTKDGWDKSNLENCVESKKTLKVLILSHLESN